MFSIHQTNAQKQIVVVLTVPFRKNPKILINFYCFSDYFWLAWPMSLDSLLMLVNKLHKKLTPSCGHLQLFRPFFSPNNHFVPKLLYLKL